MENPQQDTYRLITERQQAQPSMMQSIVLAGSSSYAKSVKITDRLIGDHKTFRKMLFELGQLAGDSVGPAESARLVRLVELFRDHLMIHCWAEDHFYYPAVRAVLPKAPSPFCLRYMDQMGDEHRTIEASLDRLERQVRHHPPSPGWSDTYAVFFHEVRAHMKKEEEDLFPLSERLLGGEGLEQLSRTLEENRYKAPPIRLHTQVL